MKIYFAASIRGGRDDINLYIDLINFLKQHGEVLTEQVADAMISEAGEQDLSVETIYERDMEWMKEADIVIAEVSTPSLGVGYEIGKAEEMNKPIVCMYRVIADKVLSAMVAGNKNVKLIKYRELPELVMQLKDILKEHE